MELVIKKIIKDKPVFIAPLGDIQFDGLYKKSVAFSHLQRDIDRALEEGALFIGMGDYTDVMSPKNRQKLEAGGFYDSTIEALEDRATELVDQLYENFLKPTTGRWLGLLEGHHFMTFRGKEEDRTPLMTSDMYLAQKLKTKFLGSSCIIGLDAGKGEDYKLTIFGHHGTGSGALAGSVFNKMSRVSHWLHEVDVVLMGHWTRRGAAPDFSKLGLNYKEKQLAEYIPMLVATGGYGRAYQEKHRYGLIPRGNYVERGMMAPVSLGGVLIRWEPGKKPVNVVV